MRFRLLAIITLLILISGASVVMRYWHEFIPTERTMSSVFSIDVDLMKQLEYVGAVEFPYSGRYRVRLGLPAPEVNRPLSQEALEERRFVLQGKVRVANFEETILAEEFDVTFDNTYVSVELLQFEVQRNFFSNQNTIHIEFDEPDPGFEEYYSSVPLSIRYRQKYPILD